jgi:hypothetical protein
MMHRNLTTSEWTLMALESLMERGQLGDWREFAQALKGNEQLARDALRVSEYIEDRASASLVRVLVEQRFPSLSSGGGDRASEQDKGRREEERTAPGEPRSEVTVKLSLTPEEERRLFTRATEKGQDVANYLRTLVEEELRRPPALSEILAPIHDEFRRSGMSEEELETLLEGELAEHRRERGAAKDQAQ